ncbi:Tyrosine-protein kinase receptor [Daphnia magna]|nr:Tyrosine-protein kinase receptor [Daphnia magna]
MIPKEVGRPSEMRCCHEECAGGCSGNQSNQCDVCKHVIHNDECRSVCPPGHYLFMKRRCVTDIECITMPPPRQSIQEYPYVKWNWKVFDKTEECILECPPGYQEEKKQLNGTLSYFTCVPCQGPCPKICKGSFLSNIETVQKLRGCTTIDGDLEMQIKGGDNIIQELERSLGSIETIRGVLKITRSFPILSLSFFKSLKTITGKPDAIHSSGSKNFDDEYALTVQDNQNLQQLWPKTQNLTIHKKVLFHFNPKLCLNLIEELVNSSRLPGAEVFKYSDVDISPWSNGDKATCDEQLLNVTVINKSDKSMQLSWNNFRATLADKRQLLGYVISYIEAPYANISYFDRRDACGGDGWTTIDVPANAEAEPEENEITIITYLKPYTQYAIYVQTYTVAPQHSGKRIGARSLILYERTSPAEPDQPEDLRAYANSSSELIIEWKPPINPNGIVSFYIVTGSWRKDDQDYVDKHDSCAEHVSSLVVSETKKAVEEASPENRTSIFSDPTHLGMGTGGNNNAGAGGGGAVNVQQGKCCECTGPNDKVTLEKKEKEQQFKIEFENFLHDKIYIKDTHIFGRNKRHVDTTTAVGEHDMNAIEFPEEKPMINSSQNQATAMIANENHTNIYDNNRLVTFYQKVTGTTYTVVGVRHYAEYTIQVVACHDPDPVRGRTLCSMTAVTSARTKQSDYADDIVGGITRYDSNHTSRSIKIGWKEPDDPNGLITKYLLEYRRSDNGKIVKECVRRKDFVESNKTRVLGDLIPGNYCVQVRAFSLAGPGPPTKDVCFLIEEHFNGLSGGILAGILVLVLIVVISILCIGYFFMKNKKNKDEHGIISINPDYHKYVPDEWEVARDNVVIMRELGQGSFGMVYEGLLRNTVPNEPEVKCAIKTVNEKANIKERMEFLTEASVMKEFKAHHVLKLLGVVSKAQPTLVIMELMVNGDLKSYLRSHRPDCEENVDQGRQPPTLKCILKMAIEIADGMMYLSEKKYVHRDLAARNCMVAFDLTVKIGDFGLTRDIYETDYYRKGGKGLLPVRWMAPESLRDGVYTSQCDVWSFGVVLWEMATLASQPYQGLTNEQVLKYVIDGGVMERPEGCPDRLYILMESCWQFLAKKRPTFIDLIENLLPDVPSQFASVSFYHSDVGVSARAALKAQYEKETQFFNDPSSSLREALLESGGFLVSDPLSQNRLYGSAEILQIDDERQIDNESGIPLVSDPRFETRRNVEGEEDLREDELGDEDHVPVLFPHDRGGAYILVKNPGGHVAANGNGSKSESSKGTTSMTSEDSKGSYVSNGSASNGYVMGILKQRRHNNTEC